MYNTNHHQFVLTADYLNNIPQLVWNYGEPFADSSSVPSYYISKVAREFVKVVLVGDGGDESFAGYHRTTTVYTASLYNKIIPQFLSAFSFPPF